MSYIITGSTYNSSFLADFAKRSDTIVMSGEELEQTTIEFTPKDKVYVPSETSLSIVMDRMQDKSYVEGINQLKDKYVCRQALSSFYPDFYFARATSSELKMMGTAKKKIAIKPLKGFFGTGVRIAEIGTDLKALADEMDAEVKANSRFFPESILSPDDYIIEEFLEGDEYAVDMFFDSDGKAVIVNIYRHPEPLIPEYFHLLYYTNLQVFEEFLEVFTRFFENLNGVLNLKNFPIHAEFKHHHGMMSPLELNPMRYGGFGLADLTAHSFGFLPIASYFDNQAVDWDSIWQSRKQNHYGWVLGYNGKDISAQKHSPDHEKFQDMLRQKGKIMDYVKLDHTSNPVFALAYIKSDSLALLMELLATEFNDYFME